MSGSLHKAPQIRNNMKKLSFLLVFSFCFFINFLSAQTGYELVGEQTICEGECAWLEVQPTPMEGEFIYYWFVDNLTNDPIVTEVPNIEICDLWGWGTYQVDLIMESANGNIIDSLSTWINVEGGGFLEIYSNASDFCPANTGNGCDKVCEFTTVNYFIEQNGSPGSTQIQWDIQGATSWTEINPWEIEVTWGEAGSGMVIATSWDWCISTASECVEILESPDASFETMPPAISDVLNICQGQQVNFTNTTDGAVYFEWNLGEGDLSAEANPEKTYNNAGTFEISLIAKNECLCADTTFMTVEVEPTISPFVDCVGTICDSAPVTYTSDADCGDFFWTVSSNGTVTDGGGVADNFITIEWGNGPYGMIELSVSSCNGSYCLEPAMIQIPIMTGNAPIVGAEQVCKGSAETYSIQHYSSTYYNWSVTNGQILAGQGTNSLSVQWNDPFNLPAAGLIEVDYENCYLECGGSASLDIDIVDEFILLGDAEVCPDGIGEYNAQSLNNGNPVTCDWSLVDPSGTTIWTFANASQVNIPYPSQAGMYMVKVEPSNPTGYCNDKFELITHVANKPDPVTSISGDFDICPGETYQYEAVVSNPNNGINWYITNGTDVIEREGNPIAISWNATGPYEISVTQTDYSQFPCESDAISQSLMPIGNIDMSAEIEACVEDVQILSATVLDLGSYQWTITPDDMGSIISEPDQSQIEILWHKDGNATVEVSVCGVSDSRNIEVFPLPEPIADHPIRLCANETGTVSSGTQAFAEYVWKDDNGVTVSIDPSPDLYPGSYELVVTDNNGCTGNTAFTIETLPLPNIRISTPDDTGVCTADGEPLPLLYALNSEDGYSYEWFKDNVSVGNNDPLYQVTDLGFYTVVVTDFNGCTNVSNTINVFEFCGTCNGTANDSTCVLTPCLSNTGDVDFTYSVTGECNVLDFQSSGFGIQPGTTQWYFDDSPSGANNTSNLENPTHIFSNAGFYTVILFGDVEDASNPGDLCTQYEAKTVEIPLVAKWAFDKACPGAPVNFIDLSSYLPGNTISSWSWDFGHPASGIDNVSGDRNPTHIYDDPGSYDVTLVISDGACTSTLVQTITIYPLPIVDITPPSVECANTAIEFESVTTDPIVTYEWDFGDVSSGEANTSGLSTSYHAYENPGVYTVGLTTTNIYGCSNYRSIQVEIEPNLNNGDITANVPIPICEGESADITSPAGGVSWEWSTGETSETITVSEEDIYMVTLTDQFGCTYEPDGFVVEVTPAPITSIRALELAEYGQTLAIFYDGYATCEGEDVIIEAIDYDDLSYTWSNNLNGNVLEFSEDRGNLLDAGEYDFSVVITDMNTGCTNEIGPFHVTIHANPDPIVISSNPGGYLCAGATTELIVDNPQLGVDYIWSNGESGTSIFVEISGEYFVKGYNQYGCSTESDAITVHAAPDIGLIPSGCLERCAPDTICLPTIPNIQSFQWYHNDVAIPAPNGTSAEFVAYESGEYYVVLTDVFGCVATSESFYLDLIDPVGDLDGQVYYDVNENGIVDAGDTLVPNAQIYLYEGGVKVDSVLTDANGNYLFDDIPSTEYTVVFDENSVDKALAYEPSILTELQGCDAEETVVILIYFNCENITVDVDHSICPGSTVMYNGLEIGVDTSFVQVYQAAGGCDSTETVTIQLLQSDVSAYDVSICAESSTEIDGVELFPGDDHIFVYTNAVGCDSTIEVSVLAYPETTFDLDMQLSCPNVDNGLIEILNGSGNGPLEYSLDGNTFGSSAIFENLPPADYSVYVKDVNGCIVEDAIEVESFEALDFELDIPVLACDQLEVQIDLDMITGNDYDITWSDGTVSDFFVANSPGTYQVTLQNNCETITHDFIVEAEDPMNDGVYIPNIFTPNNDERNDRFMFDVSQNASVQLETFEVFDRWGNLVFRSNDQQIEWDGKYKGQMLLPGVYVYQIKAAIINCHVENESYVRHGDITLLR